MPNPYVNKVTVNNVTIIDLTADTVTAATLMQGYTAHDASGAPITGTASGGGSGYVLSTVCPQQTVQPSSERVALLSGMDQLIVGENYLVTFDGTQYLTTCANLWTDNHLIGDPQTVWTTNSLSYPFAILTDGTDEAVYCADTSTHTVKVERLEFVQTA